MAKSKRNSRASAKSKSTPKIEQKDSDETIEESSPLPAVSASEIKETWDIMISITRLISNPGTSEASKKKQKCMAEGCDNIAVAAWSSNIKPHEPWYTCEVCQENDFGGWPDDFQQEYINENDNPVSVIEEGQSKKEDANQDEEAKHKQGKGAKEEGGGAKFTDERHQNANELTCKTEKEEQRNEKSEKKKEYSEEPGDTSQCKNSGDKSKNATEQVTECGKNEDNLATAESTMTEVNQIESPNKKDISDKSNGKSTESSSLSHGDFAEDNSSSGKKDRDVDKDSCDDTSDDGEGNVEVQWELKHIFTLAEINVNKPLICMTQGCKLVACCKYVSSIDPSDIWHSCLDCQNNDYGGWPEASELPVRFMTEEHKKLIGSKCTEQESPEMPNIPSSVGKDAPDKTPENSNRVDVKHQEVEEILGGDEEWDLKHIFTIDEIKKKEPVMCMTKNCPLVACCKYISSVDTSNIWASCLDCQEQDYGGWPDETELPIKFLTEKHKEVIIEKCTARYSPKMPFSLSGSGSSPSKTESTTSKKERNAPSTVTPTQGHKLLEDTDKTCNTGYQSNGVSNKVTITPPPAVPTPSIQALAIHKKVHIRLDI